MNKSFFRIISLISIIMVLLNKENIFNNVRKQLSPLIDDIKLIVSAQNNFYDKQIELKQAIKNIRKPIEEMKISNNKFQYKISPHISQINELLAKIDKEIDNL